MDKTWIQIHTSKGMQNDPEIKPVERKPVNPS